MTELEPSVQFAELHGQILSWMGEIDRMETDDGGALEDRAVRAYEIRQALIRVLGDLKNDPADPYIVGLKRYIEDYVHEAISTLDMVQEPFKQRSERLGKMSPPRHWRKKHAQYVQALRDYRSTLHDYYAALGDEDIGTIRYAAKEMSARHKEMTRFTEVYGQELGYHYRGLHSRDAS